MTLFKEEQRTSLKASVPLTGFSSLIYPLAPLVNLSDPHIA